MIPINLSEEITMEKGTARQPDLTFHIVEQRIITGMADGLEAVRQAIEICLNTERYEHMIYTWDYGVELHPLIGQDVAYCCPEIARRVQDALLQDERILSVDEWRFEKEGHTIIVSFTVHTIYGDVDQRKEVEV